jgi:hypothetical protein
MIGKRAILASAGMLAVIGTSVAGGTSAGAAPVNPPVFSDPTPAGVFGGGFETDLRLDYSGNNQIAYESAPQSLSSTISTLQRSLDGGLTWKLIPGSASGAAGGKNFTCPFGGGDSELDTAAGHLYFSDLTLANYTVARSDDKGQTFSGGTNCLGVADAGVDRPWLTHLGDPTAPTSAANGPGEFLVNDEFPTGTVNQTACPGSTNNILVVARSPVFGDNTGVTTGVQYGTALPLSCDEGIMGNDEVFDYGVGAGGAFFYDVHDNAALNKILVVKCSIGAETLTNATGLTACADLLVADFSGTPAYDPRCPCKTGGNFPTMAVDNQGNLFTVWEETPTGGGDTLLFFSVSMNKGVSWSTPAEITSIRTTGGLHQAVFAWPGAGDPGRIDVAFYGAPEASPTGNPDTINGHYGLYLVQTVNNGLTWSAPVLASEHFIHYGTMYTLIGGQAGNRSLGDFLQLRIGPQGEANVSFADSNNQNSGSTPEAMFVRQSSGPSVFAAQNGTGNVSLAAAPAGNCVTDPSGDAKFEALNTVGANNPNLDITGLCVIKPDSTHYKVTMNIADLTSVTPSVGGAPGGTTLIWQTQWHVPSQADTANGGDLFVVYGESVAGQTSCWAGKAATIAVGGGVELTYPGLTQLTGAACVFTMTAPGSVVITVPTNLVHDPPSVTSPDSSILYSVAGSTQTIPSGNAETPAPVAGIGGQLFNAIDVAQAFDFNPSQQTCNGPGCNIPETPWVPVLLILPGTAVAILALRRRRSSDGQSVE